MNDLPLNLNDAMGTIKEPLKLWNCTENTLSVAMICRNEKKNIRAAVESFLPFADEIVINDTGSTDGTIDILEALFREGKANYILNEWKEDFALARNQAIEHCTKSWILWMDADDRVDPAQAKYFSDAKFQPLDRIVGFKVTNTEGGLPLGSSFIQARMFPNHPQMRFERPIHEQVIYNAARLGLHQTISQGQIMHTGYEDEAVKKDKARRNLRMAIGYNPKDYSIKMSIADSYAIIGETEKALEWNLEVFNDESLGKRNRDAWITVASKVGHAYHEKKDYTNAIKYYKTALERQPDNIMHLYQIAKVFEDLREFDLAIDLYYMVLDAKKTISSQALKYDKLKMNAYHLLTRLLMGRDRVSECLTVFERLRKEYPGVKAV